MKPVAGPGIHSGDKKEEAQSIKLTDEEILVLKHLKEKSTADLNEVKVQAGLSNKMRDLAIKGLRN